ncbi:hypothetical protein LBX01_04165 [Altererythrobacter sp. N1]|nr:hypothetical protein LBX01_04165 [Altererythrobacter sp. N1]
MMTIEQHIEELRAELNGNDDPAERKQIAAELAAALRQHEERDGRLIRA